MTVIIDVHNMLHEVRLYQKLSLKHYEEALQKMIHDLVQYRDWTGDHLVLVFDGTLREDLKRYGVEMIFSGFEKSADACIEAWVAKASSKSNILVVTQDHGIQNLVTALGARFISPSQFKRSMDFEIENHKPKRFKF
ncbi:MAG: NYN domain-containing protein [Chlamydiae bacterium]|nr:NYN domain-containing protein [Chlamydiota bacterium]MBI3276521.1 NYN domain-containing protein [Chlamydiota bacterium]